MRAHPVPSHHRTRQDPGEGIGESRGALAISSVTSPSPMDVATRIYVVAFLTEAATAWATGSSCRRFRIGPQLSSRTAAKRGASA